MDTAAMAATVSRKLGLRDGIRAIFVGAPEAQRDAIDPHRHHPAAALTGEFDYIHVFVTTQADLDRTFPRLKGHLRLTGMLWVSWPKGRKLESDLVMQQVIRIGYGRGLVESKCISVDATWSALKFTHPRPGKIYDNRYGRLPANDDGNRPPGVGRRGGE